MNRDIRTVLIRYLWLTLLVALVSACDGIRKDDQALVASAIEYIDQRDVRAAAIELQNALQINPGNAEARYWLARINLDVGSANVAEKEFRRAIEAGYPVDKVVVDLALALLEQGHLQQLLEEIEIDPQWPSATRAQLHAIRAAALVGDERLVEARESLARASALQADDLQVLMASARLMIADGDTNSALDTLNRARERYPQSIDVLFLMAGIAYQNEQPAQIKRLLESVIEIDLPKIVTVYEWRARLGMAQILMDEGETDQAWTVMQPLMSRIQGDADALYMTAMLAYRKGDYALAGRRLIKVLELKPDHRPALLLQGSVNYFQGAYEQAAYYLSKYVSTVPEDLSARKLLGQAYLELDAHRQLREVLRPVIDEQQHDAEILAMLGMSALRTGQLQAGVSEIEKAVAMAPDNSRLRQYLARAYIISGEPGRAIKELETVLARGGGERHAEILLILAHLRAGDNDRAIVVAMAMVRDDPNDPRILTVAGNVFLVTGDTPQARLQFESALTLAPDFLPAAMAMARVYEIEGEFDRARRHYENIIAGTADKMYPMLALANLEERQGNMDRMAYWLTQASERAPDKAAPRVALAEYQFRQGAMDAARQLVEEALTIDPPNIRARLLQVRLSMAGRKYDQALPRLEALAEERPESLPVSLLLAETYLHLDNADDARRLAERVLERQPDSVPAHMLMAAVCLDAGDAAQALERARTLQTLRPDWYKSYEIAGDARMMLGDPAGAEGDYKQAMRYSQAADPLLKLVQVYLNTSRLSLAVDQLTQWLSSNGSDARVSLSLGIVYQRMGNRLAAVEAYQQALVLDADNPVALNNLAGLYDVLGDPRALAVAERAYRSGPGLPDIQDTYGWLLVRNDRPGEGRVLLEKALQGLPGNPDVQYHLAVALLRSGQRARASGMLSELIESGAVFEGRQEAIDILDELK